MGGGLLPELAIVSLAFFTDARCFTACLILLFGKVELYFTLQIYLENRCPLNS